MTADDDNVERIKGVIAFSFPNELDSQLDVIQCVMKRFYLFTIENHASVIDITTQAVDSKRILRNAFFLNVLHNKINDANRDRGARKTSLKL